MSKRIFNIDFDRLIVLMLPTFLRVTSVTAFIKAYQVSIKSVFGSFSNNRISNLYKLSHNGQVCYLRKVLNDSFDPRDRRIKITDGNSFQREYIYTKAEAQPQYLGTMYLRQSNDFADTGFDFRVLVPAGFDLQSVIHQMNAVIDYYKLASKRYKIQYENE